MEKIRWNRVAVVFVALIFLAIAIAFILTAAGRKELAEIILNAAAIPVLIIGLAALVYFLIDFWNKE